jgi:hypothetical protein
MFIPILTFVHPGSRIQKQQQKRGVKKIRCPTFFSSHKNHKIVKYINFELVKKKIWANLQRIIELSAQKIVIKLSKIWIWDPGSGSGLNNVRIPVRICNTGNLKSLARPRRILPIWKNKTAK